MTEFLNAFWPNLAATIIGVALGLPVALYLNRNFASDLAAHASEISERLQQVQRS